MIDELTADALDHLKVDDRAEVPNAIHETRKLCKKARGPARLVRPALEDDYTPTNHLFRDAARELGPIRDPQAISSTFEDLIAVPGLLSETVAKKTGDPSRAPPASACRVWFNGPSAMAVGSDRRVIVGIILIVVGIGLLALQLFEGLGRFTWPLLLGALFLTGYFVRRAYGFLVAGGILFGIGLGQLGEEIFDVGDGIETIGLGLGFISIFLIDRFDRADAPWWPLIPGLILLATGLGSVGGEIANVMDYVWPGLLILLGLALIFGLSRNRD